MKRLFQKLFSFINSIQSKIAFYPTLFAISGFVSAFLLIYLEGKGVSKYLVENFPTLVVNNGDTALTILSACITGLISMMVFSFSMVMVILNQASSNYSPRLLPGLISEKNHQVILGIYLSTILYCIFIAVSIQPEGDKYQVPGFSVLLGIIATVVCICAFIYFIHSISQNIQINNILDGIYGKAERRLDKLIESEDQIEECFEGTDDWHAYHIEKTGYFQNVAIENLLEICEEQGTRLKILPVKGMFVLRGVPVFLSEKELDEDTIKTILSNFNFARGELVEDNYNLAFKQITEVIVKAMSPGINDPGTAINAIDYLTQLLAKRMQKDDISIIKKDDQKLLELSTVNFKDLMYNVLVDIRIYCKSDMIICQKIALMFYYLQNRKAKKEQYYEVIAAEARNYLEDCKEAATNKADLEVINRLFQKLKLE